jgi:hypothetical protein
MAVCVTVDVEDFFDGMAVLGHELPRVPGGSGLAGLRELLEGDAGPPAATGPRLTLFVVGDYLARVADDLADFVRLGHEVACHGPDHGRLPDEPSRLRDWLRRGRAEIEDALETAVSGFRSPRFDVPASMPLDRYREVLAEAGFTYVSDRHRVGSRSAVAELPVLHWGRFPMGGGSYQRFLPRPAVRSALRSGGPTVLYYHSYDFGVPLPRLADARSIAVVKQVVVRGRIVDIVRDVLARAGSITCREAVGGL